MILHDYDAAGREVLIRLPVETLGDTLGSFPYAVKFKERYGCRLTAPGFSSMCNPRCCAWRRGLRARRRSSHRAKCLRGSIFGRR